MIILRPLDTWPIARQTKWKLQLGGDLPAYRVKTFAEVIGPKIDQFIMETGRKPQIILVGPNAFHHMMQYVSVYTSLSLSEPIQYEKELMGLEVIEMKEEGLRIY